MKLRLIQIGNSRGVRIPKAIIEQCDLKDEVELSVKDGVLTIASAPNLRAGWDTAFRAMAEAGDDALLIPDDLGTEWDEKEWEW